MGGADLLTAFQVHVAKVFFGLKASHGYVAAGGRRAARVGPHRSTGPGHRPLRFHAGEVRRESQDITDPGVRTPWRRCRTGT